MTLLGDLIMIGHKTANMLPRSIIRVTGVRDLTTGHDSTQPDNKAVLPVSASSQMVGFVSF